MAWKWATWPAAARIAGGGADLDGGEVVVDAEAGAEEDRVDLAELARQATERFPLLPVEEEGRLLDARQFTRALQQGVEQALRRVLAITGHAGRKARDEQMVAPEAGLGDDRARRARVGGLHP